LLTGQWQNLHHRSTRLTGCAHAGHCWSFPRTDVVPRARRDDFAGVAGGAALRGGAPGSRMWQWGQCSGPAASDRRQSGHV